MADGMIQMAVAVPAEAQAKLLKLAVQDQRRLGPYCRKVLLDHLAQIEKEAEVKVPAEVA